MVRSIKMGPVNTFLSTAHHTVQSAAQNDVSTTLYGSSGAQKLMLCLFTNPSSWTVEGDTSLSHKRYAITTELIFKPSLDYSDQIRLFNFVRKRHIPSQDGVPSCSIHTERLEKLCHRFSLNPKQ